MQTPCTLNLDSSRIPLDTLLGHTPTPSVSNKSCHLCFFPGEPHLLEVSVGCALPVSFWSTWFSLVSWYLPVQCLLWYALMIHTQNISKPAKRIALYGKLIAKLRNIACRRLWDYRVLLCHTTQMNAPVLTSVRQAGRLLDLHIPEGWKVELILVLVIYLDCSPVRIQVVTA